MNRPLFYILYSIYLFLSINCKSNRPVKIEKEKPIQVFKFILYPVVAENREFADKLLLTLKEVIEYTFLQEVILQNYIPKESSEVQSDLETLNAKSGLICKIDSLNLFFPQRIFFRCYIFKKEKQASDIDISKILTKVKEENIKQNGESGYKFFDISIDLNSKEALDEAMRILQKSKKEKVFLPEHLFLKQRNFLFIIKEKFSRISKKYLFE